MLLVFDHVEYFQFLSYAIIFSLLYFFIFTLTLNYPQKNNNKKKKKKERKKKGDISGLNKWAGWYGPTIFVWCVNCTVIQAQISSPSIWSQTIALSLSQKINKIITIFVK